MAINIELLQRMQEKLLRDEPNWKLGSDALLEIPASADLPCESTLADALRVPDVRYSILTLAIDQAGLSDGIQVMQLTLVTETYNRPGVVFFGLKMRRFASDLAKELLGMTSSEMSYYFSSVAWREDYKRQMEDRGAKYATAVMLDDIIANGTGIAPDPEEDPVAKGVIQVIKSRNSQ